MESSSVVLAAFGNPLWDLCVSLPDNGVLSLHDLADDSSKEATAPEFESLLRAVQGYPKKGCPGGAALNTLRIFQWLLDKEKSSSVFFGSIGTDDMGKQLANDVSSAGVSVRFKCHFNLMTGCALCLIHKELRTLVAHLGAANVYNQEDLTEVDRNIVAKVQVVYIENFFFHHSADVVWEVVKLCKIHGVAIAFNLSGAYLFESHAVEIASLIKYVNVVIGNENEYQALAQTSEWKYSHISDLATAICMKGVQTPISSLEVKVPKLQGIQDLGKVVVITRGNKPVLCIAEKKSAFSTSVLPPRLGVKDTTGAGDAFAAGFLMGVIKGFPLDQCVHLGCYASSEIIQQIGCNPPDYAPLDMVDIDKLFA